MVRRPKTGFTAFVQDIWLVNRVIETLTWSKSENQNRNLGVISSFIGVERVRKSVFAPACCIFLFKGVYGQAGQIWSGNIQILKFGNTQNNIR